MRRVSVWLAIVVLGLFAVGCGSSSVTSTLVAPAAEPSVAAEPPVAEVTPTAAMEVESTSVLEGAKPPAAEVTSTAAVGAASASILESADLTAFVEAWNSGKIEAIRAFYSDDAAYVSAEQVIALQRKEPVSVLVAEDAFAERVRERQGQQMRILGEPIKVSDKLIGFAFRWEEGSAGYNGVALLRYEGGKIWLHTYTISTARTSNLSDEATLKPVDLDGLMEVWSAGDVSAVKGFYAETGGIFPVFNDEDIANSLKGIVHSAQELAGGYLTSEVRGNAAQWGMTAVGQPLRLGDLVLYAWSWKAFDYPVGYGVRFMRYDGAKISMDIRYALRPWEAQGQSFASGYK